MEFQITLGPEQIRTLSYAVNEAIRLWPGSPARPAEEQEWLWHLRDSFFALQMELVLDQDVTRDVG